MFGKSIAVIVFAALAALAWSFTPQRLKVPEGAVDSLPAFAVPVAVRIGVLETGTMESNALFAFRGGRIEPRSFGMDVIVVQHPRGTFLIDAGFGRRVLDHAATVPALMRATAKIAVQTSARDQLEKLGYTPGQLMGVVLTHAHWDHVSGLDDLRELSVFVNADERRFIEHGGDMSLLVRGFGGLRYRDYSFDGGPYAGFAHSHDLFGDGSVVLVPAPGHTPGSIIIFVRTPERDYAFIGDIAWQLEGIDLPAERPWASRWLVDVDAAAVRDLLVRLHRLQAYSPRLTIVPAHDRRVTASLPRLTAMTVPTTAEAAAAPPADAEATPAPAAPPDASSPATP